MPDIAGTASRLLGTQSGIDFGRYHPAFAADGGPLGLLNGDERGGFGDNGKVSLSSTVAGSMITRSNLAWTTAPGQAGNVNFAFRSTAPTTMPDDTTAFTRFTDTQIAATLLAMAAWSDVANITFTRVNDGDGYSDGATMLFGNYGAGAEGAAAFAYLPNNRSDTSSSGDVWINSSLSYNATPLLLGYGQQVLLHEIGHAIGLSHPASYNAGPGVVITYAAHAGYYEDSRQYTVMSYFSETSTGGSFGSGRYSSAPLLDDIAAAQRLYGANMTTRTGDTTYGFNSNAGQAWFSAASAASVLVFAVWDAGGTDTFDFSGYSNRQVIDLRQGGFSDVGGLTSNVAVAIGAVIENAMGGSGIDYLGGNSADNVLTGGLGNDIIEGGLGVDTAVFSGPRSAYTITWRLNEGTVIGPDGTDTIFNVEFLRFADQTIAAPPTGGIRVTGDILNNTIVGTATGDSLAGGAGDDILEGGAGNDYLGGGYGNDVVSGGDGNDFIFGDPGNDSIDGGAGIDGVDYSGGVSGPTGSIRLPSGVSIDLTTGRATGGGGIDVLTGIENITGTGFDDMLRGDGGANTLHGGGGADLVFGGGGDDLITAAGGSLIGGAPDVIKARTTANASVATAISLDGSFDLLSSLDIANSTTIPHATVTATTHGGMEYYAFTVTAGRTITLDIDNGSFDTTLRLIGPGGGEVAANDDSAADGGPPTDSQLTFTATTGGVYYVAVGEWEANAGSTFTSRAPAAGGAYTLHVSVASHAVVPLTLVGSTLYGEAGNDTIFGGTAGDTLIGGAGNDSLNGGAGTDSAVFSGLRRQYSASATSVSGGSDGTDSMIFVENAVFADGVLTFDVESASAQVMRLYSATLNRAPDQAGLEAQVGAHGTFGLQGLADNFVASAEFQARFGALNNQQFVEQMYVFTLGRQGDAPGIAAWVNLLNGGTTRGQVVVGFSESAEHRLRTTTTLNAGLWVPDAEAQIIARLYDAAFDRLPDTAGLAGWVAILDAGSTSLQQIAAAFAGSPEFQARYGALSNQQFVEQLYRFCLNREGDPAGISGWVGFIDNGMSRAQVLLNFSESPEHVALTAASWLGGIRYDGYVGAPLEDADAKGLHNAQVLPGAVDDAIIYDPADLGLTLETRNDAFVLPADPDGGVRWIQPIDDVLLSPLPAALSAALPQPAANDLLAVIPATEMVPGDPAAGMHRDHLDLAWA